MNTCQTCRYWRTKFSLLGKPPAAEKQEGDLHVCTQGWFDVYDTDMAIYDTSCSSDYSTRLLATKPEFGCIHHEPENTKL